MNENAKKWVQWLRDHPELQGHDRLDTRDKDGNPIGYCCLGAACVVYQESVPESERLKVSLYGNRCVYDGASFVLPSRVSEWLGLASRNGAYGPDDSRGLISDNDNGKTFAEIADIIESEPTELFAETD